MIRVVFFFKLLLILIPSTVSDGAIGQFVLRLRGGRVLGVFGHHSGGWWSIGIVYLVVVIRCCIWDKPFKGSVYDKLFETSEVLKLCVGHFYIVSDIWSYPCSVTNLHNFNGRER